MKGEVPFNVVEGNLFEAYIKIHNHDGLCRFDVMNLDLCATAGSFFTSEDKFILNKLADNAELSINTRVRQDKLDLDFAGDVIEVFKNVLPEFQLYFDALLEQKKDLFPDTVVAENMVRRQMSMIFSVINAFPFFVFPCCKKADDQFQEIMGAIKAVLHLELNGNFPFRKNDDPYDKFLHVHDCYFDPEIGKMGSQMSKTDHFNLQKKLRTISSKRGKGESAKRPVDFDEKIHKEIGNKLKEYGLEDEPDRNDPRYLRIASEVKIMQDIFAISLTRRYLRVGLEDISCVTYTHDTHHTFQNWMMSIRKTKNPVSLLDILRKALDSLINNPEVFIDGNANLRKWQPTERRKVAINKDRVLDLHRDHKLSDNKLKIMYGNDVEGIRISPIEKERRTVRRRIEKHSRRKNRA